MPERLVNVDRDTPMMLPPDMRDWVGEDHPVHFYIAAVDELDLSALKVNRRGSGSPQYPPRMMLTLVLYCYSHGLLSSRKIEKATYENLAVRYLTGDTHPDHDTICTFRAENGEAIRQAFVGMGKLAQRLEILKLGTVSVDGTHIKANASKHKSLRYDRIRELEAKLEADIADLLEQARSADSSENDSEHKLPKEVRRRQALRRRLQDAKAELEAQHAEANEPDNDSDDDHKGSDDGGSRKVCSESTPPDSAQINLTDSDSRIMRKSRYDSYTQAYNAQAAFDADGTQLILATSVIQTPSDSGALEPAVEEVESTLGNVEKVVADTGYRNIEAIERLETGGTDVYVATGAGDHNWRRYDFRPPKKTAKRELKHPTLRAMREKIRSEAGRKIYSKRARSAEAPFGTIKQTLGYRQFLRRGLKAVSEEWTLVCLAYNAKRLCALTGGRIPGQ